MTPRAEEALRLLEVNALAELLGARKLRGAQNLYRIRVGDYRILYEIHASTVTVIVVKIGRRRDAYRRVGS